MRFATRRSGNIIPVRRRRALILVGGIVVIWAAIAAVIVALAAEQAISAERLVTAARHSVLGGSSDRPAVASDLAKAQRRFARAHTLAGSPVLLPLRILPGTNRQIASFDALARAGSRVTAAIERAGRTSPEFGATSTSPDRRVSALAGVARIASEIDRDVHGVNLGPRTWLLPPLASRRAKFQSDVDSLHRAAAVTAGLEPILRGPRRYLVLAANNAE